MHCNAKCTVMQSNCFQLLWNTFDNQFFYIFKFFFSFLWFIITLLSNLVLLSFFIWWVLDLFKYLIDWKILCPIFYKYFPLYWAFPLFLFRYTLSSCTLIHYTHYIHSTLWYITLTSDTSDTDTSDTDHTHIWYITLWYIHSTLHSNTLYSDTLFSFFNIPHTTFN